MKTIMLFKSALMDDNKKQGRDEHGLVRFSKNVRDTLGISNKDTVTLTNGPVTQTKIVFHAYKEDIAKIKVHLQNGLIPPALTASVGFVSSKTLAFLGGEDRLVLSLMKPSEDFLIGTDPELLLFHPDTEKIVHAGSIHGLRKDTPFGSDGAMAELRPKPAFDPRDLVMNIQHILDTNKEKPVGKFKWISSCYHMDNTRDYPVGTHIHFDNLGHIATLNGEKRSRLFAVTNKIVDELLTLPMIRLDGKKGFNRRAHCKMGHAGGFGNAFGKGYGYFGEWRTCNGHLEHRSLSGLIISNPELAANVFAVAKTIVEAVYKRALDKDLKDSYILPNKFHKAALYATKFNDWKEIPLAKDFDCTASSEFMSNAMDQSSRTEIHKTFVERWAKKMQTLPTYGKYGDCVEWLEDFLCSSAKTLDSIDTNIKANWK